MAQYYDINSFWTANDSERESRDRDRMRQSYQREARLKALTGQLRDEGNPNPERTALLAEEAFQRNPNFFKEAELENKSREMKLRSDRIGLNEKIKEADDILADQKQWPAVFGGQQESEATGDPNAFEGMEPRGAAPKKELSYEDVGKFKTQGARMQAIQLIVAQNKAKDDERIDTANAQRGTLFLKRIAEIAAHNPSGAATARSMFNADRGIPSAMTEQFVGQLEQAKTLADEVKEKGKLEDKYKHEADTSRVAKETMEEWEFNKNGEATGYVWVTPKGGTTPQRIDRTPPEVKAAWKALADPKILFADASDKKRWEGIRDAWDAELKKIKRPTVRVLKVE